MHELTIQQAQTALANGDFNSQELCEYYLDRIATLDKRGPSVNSVIELNPQALDIARALDDERARGRARGPLHGVPLLLKDNIDTADQMQTTAGSLALEGSIAKRDAHIVKRLRAAGALILGKTNLSEWANFRGRRSTSGWSSRGGLTRNPHALDRTACGSSSGSGAAVAADFCLGAIGTETDGSIICPAQTCGIVGLKPTLGLLSRGGIIPIAHSQDTAGPMTRTVADAAYLLSAMAGVDARDPATQSARRHAERNYTVALDPNGLKGARIGVARNLAGSDARVLRVLDKSIAVLRALGATVVDPTNLPNLPAFAREKSKVLFYEFKDDLNRYLAGLGRHVRVRSMDAVIAFNKTNSARVLAHFGQEYMIEANGMGSLNSAAYKRDLARGKRLMGSAGIDAALKRHKLDALICPSGGPAYMIDLVNGDASTWDVNSTTPAAVAGYPHITVPAGQIAGLPIGLSFFSGAWRETVLLRLAFAFEQATLARMTPQFQATAKF